MISGAQKDQAQKSLPLIKLGAIDQAARVREAIEPQMGWQQMYVRNIKIFRREIERLKSRPAGRGEDGSAGRRR